VPSCAGKTEATKSVLQYLSTVAGSVDNVNYMGMDGLQSNEVRVGQLSAR